MEDKAHEKVNFCATDSRESSEIEKLAKVLSLQRDRVSSMGFSKK
jgi:hypothetical protein